MHPRPHSHADLQKDTCLACASKSFTWFRSSSSAIAILSRGGLKCLPCFLCMGGRHTHRKGKPKQSEVLGWHWPIWRHKLLINPCAVNPQITNLVKCFSRHHDLSSAYVCNMIQSVGERLCYCKISSGQTYCSDRMLHESGDTCSHCHTCWQRYVRGVVACKLLQGQKAEVI